MSLFKTPPVSENRAQEIYARLIDQDPVAPSDLAIAFLDDLAGWLERKYPQIDPHLCCSAAEDAILSLIKNPNTYDPGRLSLAAYLRMSASGDLKNILQSELRHQKRRADLNVVELSDVDRNSLWSVTDPALIVERREDAKDLDQELMSKDSIPQSVRESLTAQEAKVLELMQEGERRSDVFAIVLSVEYLPLGLQRREVKRVKDRLKRRLERAGGT